MRDYAEPMALDFLWPRERHTDLHQLLRQHFALPVPLRMGLATAAQAWGIAPGAYDEDDTELLLQDTLEAAQVAQLQMSMQTRLVLLQRLWQACVAVLRSDWQQRWEDSTLEVTPTLEGACVEFLEQQRRWRERDILAVQRLPSLWTLRGTFCLTFGCRRRPRQAVFAPGIF
jgi:hypothetical protein